MPTEEALGTPPHNSTKKPRRPKTDSRVWRQHALCKLQDRPNLEASTPPRRTRPKPAAFALPNSPPQPYFDRCTSTDITSTVEDHRLLSSSSFLSAETSETCWRRYGWWQRAAAGGDERMRCMAMLGARAGCRRGVPGALQRAFVFVRCCSSCGQLFFCCLFLFRSSVNSALVSSFFWSLGFALPLSAVLTLQACVPPSQPQARPVLRRSVNGQQPVL